MHQRRDCDHACPRHHPRQNPGHLHRRERGCRVGGGEEFLHLHPHPLAGQGLQPLRQRGTGRESIGVDPLPVPGVEAEEAQDAQVILADAGLRLAHEADAAGQQVGQASERVHHSAIRLGIERVHGEVAPRGVLLQAVREGDDGPPPVRLHVAAEGGDLVGRPVRDHGDRPMRLARGDGFQFRRLRERRHPFGPRIGGDVDVPSVPAHQRIAHAAADVERAVPGILQHRHHGARAGCAKPGALQPHSRSASCRSIRAVAPQT